MHCNLGGCFIYGVLDLIRESLAVYWRCVAERFQAVWALRFLVNNRVLDAHFAVQFAAGRTHMRVLDLLSADGALEDADEILHVRDRVADELMRGALPHLQVAELDFLERVHPVHVHFVITGLSC